MTDKTIYITSGVGWDDCQPGESVWEKRIAELEAELAALRARRCPSCYFANGTDQWGTIFCAMGVSQSRKDFFCGLWEARP